jgi:energy-coupling factor transporter ATP-binding protein EcfA2
MSISINFQQVCFSYRRDKAVLNNLNFIMSADRTILLTGENGTGKSTLASLAAGLLKPLSGKVAYYANGQKLCKKEEVYQKLSFLRQKTEDNLLCATPWEDLALWLTSPAYKDSESDSVISDKLVEWNLDNRQHTPLWELSAGELKCLAFAGIALHPHRYWILDEPLSSLDDCHTQRLLSTLKAKQEFSRGMLIISHQTELFSGLADEVLILGPEGTLSTL